MMTQVQKWRRQAAQNLANRIPKIEGDLNNHDLAVDALVRQPNNQPPRPSDRKAYEGIFPSEFPWLALLVQLRFQSNGSKPT